DIFVFVERGLFNAAAAGREKGELARGLARRRNKGGQSFVAGEAQQVGDRASLGGAAALGQFVGFELVNLAGAGEEHQAVVRRDALEMFDEVLFGGGRANLAAAAALLRAIKREWGALDVTAVRDGNEDILLHDQILDRELTLRFDDLGAARIGEFFFYFVELAGDQLQQFLLVGENFLVARDESDRLFVLGFNFLALERGEPAQRQIEDRLRLQLRQAELLHQAGARGLRIL